MQKLALAGRLRYGAEKFGHAFTSIPFALTSRASSNSYQRLGPAHIPGQGTSRHLKYGEKAYFLAVSNYRVRAYGGRITLLANERAHALNPTYGWDKFAVGGIDVHKIPGNHDSCIPDNIPLVAKLLAECLQKAVAALK
jgi:hypothetical protein